MCDKPGSSPVHGGFEVLRTCSGSKHRLSIRVHVHHLRQRAVGGAHDEAARPRNRDLNLKRCSHCVSEEAVVSLESGVGKRTRTVPYSWSWGRWLPRSERSRTRSRRRTRTCWRPCIFWPLEEAEQLISYTLSTSEKHILTFNNCERRTRARCSFILSFCNTKPKHCVKLHAFVCGKWPKTTAWMSVSSFSSSSEQWCSETWQIKSKCQKAHHHFDFSSHSNDRTLTYGIKSQNYDTMSLWTFYVMILRFYILI